MNYPHIPESLARFNRAERRREFLRWVAAEVVFLAFAALIATCAVYAVAALRLM